MRGDYAHCTEKGKDDRCHRELMEECPGPEAAHNLSDRSVEDIGMPRRHRGDDESADRERNGRNSQGHL
jgi:hypothetical protein